MASLRYERRIGAPADVVWDVVRRPDWFPGIVSCTVEGNLRTIKTATGIEMPEEILTIDPLLRRFAYRITAPPYRFHLGVIDVIELGPRDSLCVYSTTAEPDPLGRVLKAIEAKGWGVDVDVAFTSDHGELQGDFGLLFKGPYHVDGLMRLPLIWRPAPSTKPVPSVVRAPVSLVSLAATLLDVAGQPTPAWVEGSALPLDDEDAHARSFTSTVTEWDSALFGVDVHVRTVVTGEHLYTEYLPGTMHDGSEGELYDLADDPLQRINRFGDLAMANVRATLSERLRAHEDRPGERAMPGVLMAPV